MRKKQLPSSPRTLRYERFFCYADWDIGLTPGIYNGKEHHLRGALSLDAFATSSVKADTA
jgi:hypothetical protein